MRERVARMNAELYRRSAEALLAAVPEDALPMPAETFVRVMHGLIEGLVRLHALSPELITDEVILAAFDALAQTKPG